MCHHFLLFSEPFLHHLNFSRASNDQFLEPRYIMHLNRTPEWKVLTSWISREPPLYNFDCLDILYPRIRHPCENLWPHEFSRASGDQFWASRYIIRQNRISEWKVMMIRILESIRCSIFERHDILCTLIGHLSEKLWPFEFLERFRCSILSVSIC